MLPQAVAAIDLALWDLAGRRAGDPVWRLLGAAGADPVEVNATIAAADRAGAAAEAAAAAAGGFRCLKAKVGIGDDAGRLAAVRAVAGPEMAIRLDANGAWSVEEALATLRVLEPVGIELCEEPVAGLERDRRGVRFDARPDRDRRDRRGAGGARRACVRRGLPEDRALRRDHRRSRCARGARGPSATRCTSPRRSTGRSGSRRALHAAAAVEPDRPCGLATLGLFDRPKPLVPAPSGRIAVPHGPGLGDGLDAWYALRVPRLCPRYSWQTSGSFSARR